LLAAANPARSGTVSRSQTITDCSGMMAQLPIFLLRREASTAARRQYVHKRHDQLLLGSLSDMRCPEHIYKPVTAFFTMGNQRGTVSMSQTITLLMSNTQQGRMSLGHRSLNRQDEHWARLRQTRRPCAR
jgi:hypothetical protein